MKKTTKAELVAKFIIQGKTAKTIEEEMAYLEQLIQDLRAAGGGWRDMRGLEQTASYTWESSLGRDETRAWLLARAVRRGASALAEPEPFDMEYDVPPYFPEGWPPERTTGHVIAESRTRLYVETADGFEVLSQRPLRSGEIRVTLERWINLISREETPSLKQVSGPSLTAPALRAGPDTAGGAVTLFRV